MLSSLRPAWAKTGMEERDLVNAFPSRVGSHGGSGGRRPLVMGGKAEHAQPRAHSRATPHRW
eukprot:scaffold3670_cov202-Prasinococcus_capsulatus_cf.AAC.1